MSHDYSPSAGEVIGEIYGQAPFIILSTVINIVVVMRKGKTLISHKNAFIKILSKLAEDHGREPVGECQS